jgi:hypothetical protein
MLERHGEERRRRARPDARSSRRRPGGIAALSRPRLVVGLVAVALLLVVGWRIIAETNAASLARTDPEAALAWRPDGAAALTSLAEQKLAEAGGKDDYDAVATLAEEALLANPLEARAIALVALARNAAGDASRVEPLMRLAASRTRRDTPVQGWLFNNALGRGDYAGALDHANAILLTNPDLEDEILNNLQVFAAKPEARSALLARLAGAPPWRTDFIELLSNGNAPPDVVFSLLSDLAVSTNPPTVAEIAPILERLVREGQFDLAYIIWLRFLPRDQGGIVKYAFNGDFELAVTGLPFDWSFPGNAGADRAIIDTRETGRGKALRLAFANKRIHRLLAIKLLALPPGRYRLTVDARALDVRSEVGLVWNLVCPGQKPIALASTPPLKGTVPWQTLKAEFEVPPDVCRGQRLTLEHPARAELERQIGGEAWFDNVVVERLAAGGES